MKGRVFVIGLGLIGGSIALSIRNAHKDAQLIGYDISEQNVQLSKLLGIVESTVPTVEEGAQDADLIIVAVPVNESTRVLAVLSNIQLKPEVIITDVGSTKKTVMDAANCLTEKGICFIGGHPMAGSHKSGAGASRPHLFENAFYLLTPNGAASPQNVEILKEWLKGTKANFLIVTPEEHDVMTGVVSHFPHIIASGLVHQAKLYNNENELIPRLAAGGFRDITRIASSSPVMWKDILLQNKEILISLMDEWIDQMQRIKAIMSEEDSKAILDFFQSAKDFRDGLPVHSKGAIPAFYDLYIDVPDYPGVISEITGYFAKEGISITNIRILETREDEIYGVLVVSFQSDADRSKAEECIKHYTRYETVIS
ncbi:prephenate dehydrogenase [Peribacillus sp. SCS-155]|uniref:prephenate dehydrogenase n=1 Tax=Peribacillus sedimenti TaxID=3115297 RepID=UPI0039061CDA